MSITFATTELVAVAWLKTLGLTGVGTTVPESIDPATGFVQIINTGSVTNPDFKLRNNVITCDVWAVHDRPNTQNPPWAHANAIAEIIVDGCYDNSKSVGIPVITGFGNIPVKVLSVYLINEPQRGPTDSVHRAHYLLDFEIIWVQAN